MTAEPIRNKKELRNIANYWLKRGNLRNYVLIVLGAYTALRISDLLGLRWTDVYDGERCIFRSHITLTERKTGKAKKIALNTQAVKALRLYLPHKRGVYIFQSNRRTDKAICRVQAWRIIRAAAEDVGVSMQVGCHGLRKTFGYHAWVGGVNPVIIMDIYNHSSYEITRRYLGVTQDDRDSVYLGAKLF